MAKPTRGGQTKTATKITATQAAPAQPAPQPAKGPKPTAQFIKTTQATQAQVQQIQQLNQQSEEHLDEQNVNVRYAVKQYIRADQQANGFSRAQNLNNKLETGGKLDATEKFMVTNMDKAMNPFGQDVKLVRADHATTATGSGVLDKLGIKNYQSMTPSQLNNAITGKTWTEQKYLSTSYDVTKNPFISGAQAGGRSVILKISAGGKVKYVNGDTKQAEYILARGNTYKATGARFTGRTVYPRAGGALKQIEIDVEVL